MDAEPRQRRIPPKRKKREEGEGEPKQYRTIDGYLLDVRSCSAFCGWSEKKTWGMLKRRLIPFRKMGGRVIFLRAEIEAWLLTFDGCTLEEAAKNHEARHDAR